MTPEDTEALFTHSNGQYLFARWGRPIVPVVFGVEDETLPAIKGAIEAVAALAGHRMAETDPELGANLMMFFVREWGELLEVPGLDRLVDGLAALVARVESARANQYRQFRFDAQGAVQAAFVFVRLDDELAGMPADVLALNQAAQVILVWSEAAFATRSPLARSGDKVILRPDVADVIRAGYDPVLPDHARDPSHALRLYARISQAK